MKRHVQVPGIRQWAAEDLLELQSEPLKAMDSFFEEYGSCVISGCHVSDNGDETYNITAGLVSLAGKDANGNNAFKIVPFSGIIGTPLPVYLTLNHTVVERQYVDGAVKPIAYDYNAATTVVKPKSIPYLELNANTILRFVDVIQDNKHLFMTDDERTKLKNAITYTHPKTHPASMIVFDDGETLQYKFDRSQEVSWEYTFSVSPETASFAPTGGNKVFTVTSYRTKLIGGVTTDTREDIAYTAAVTAGAGVFSVNGATVTAGENNTESARNGSVVFTQGDSEKAVTVSVQQGAGEVTWDYSFSINPASLSFANTGESKVVSVTSTKQKKVNGTNSGSAVLVGYTSEVVSGSDTFSINNTTISANQNNTESSKSGSITFTQGESNKTATLTLSQTASVATWEYTLSVSPESLSFDTSGGTQNVSVTSYKRKYINGSYTGEQINVGCSSSVSGSGFSSAGTAVTASENGTLSERSGTTTFKQAESGKTVAVALSQAKGVEGWNYTFSVSPASLSFEATGGTKSVSVTSYRRQTINGKETGGQENVGYTSSVSGTGFSCSSGTVVNASENTNTSGRSGSVTFTQNSSEKSVSVALEQGYIIFTFSSSYPDDFINNVSSTKYVNVECYLEEYDSNDNSLYTINKKWFVESMDDALVNAGVSYVALSDRIQIKYNGTYLEYEEYGYIHIQNEYNDQSESIPINIVNY